MYAVDNACGLAPLLISRIADEAIRLGQRAVVCPSPMNPEETEDLILPDLSLAFVSVTPENLPDEAPFSRIPLDAMARKAWSREEKLRFRHLEKLEESVVSEAVEELHGAKTIHDELEHCYNAHVDFDGVYALADAYSRRVLQ